MITLSLMTEATKEDFENEFTTIRIWREDKDWLDSMKDHERQGSHEIIRKIRKTLEGEE